MVGFSVLRSTKSPVTKIYSGCAALTARYKRSLSLPKYLPCRSLSCTTRQPSKPAGSAPEVNVTSSVSMLLLSQQRKRPNSTSKMSRLRQK